MSAAAKWCNALYWVGLAIWLAALVAAAVAAMNVFGRLPGTALTLEQYAAYPADEHGRVIAGLVMSDVFFTVDLIQFVAVPLTVACLVVQMLTGRAPRRRPALVIRAACVIAAAALFTVYAARVAPTLNRQLVEFRQAAEAGDLERAESQRAAFAAGHGRADTILRVNLVLVLTAIVASAVGQTPTAPPARAPVEPPDLLRRA